MSTIVKGYKFSGQKEHGVTVKRTWTYRNKYV